MDSSNRFRRSAPLRFLFLTLAAILAAAMATLGLSAPAFAVSTPFTFTLKLTNKVGTPLTAYAVYPILLDTTGTAAVPQDSAIDPATPDVAHPGNYTMTLDNSDSYTFAFVPTGAAAADGTVQYLGGSAFLAGATVFAADQSSPFLAASIATGSTITGKVTGPTNAALRNAEVDSYLFDGTNWVYTGFSMTSSTGAYTFVNAVPGSYRFEFYAPGGVYPPIYSGSAATLDAAATTFVPVGTTATVNQKMTVGTGTIAGTALVSDLNDGNQFCGNDLPCYDPDRLPVAFPVTAESGGQATAIDLDKAIAGGLSSSTGAWSIHNLPAGNYVVQLEPNGCGEDAVYLNPGSSGFEPADVDVADESTLQQATVFTVTAGHTIATSYSTFVLSDNNDGATPSFEVRDSGSNPINGAEVVLAPTNDPLAYASGTSLSNGAVVELKDSNGNEISDNNECNHTDNPLVPGNYDITVIDPAAAHDPYKTEMYIPFGSEVIPITMPDLSAAPGFTTPPSIAQTATAVGTSYTVAADPTREDATLSYQWLRGNSPIFGATSDTYVSTGADLYDQLSVRVTASSFGFDPVSAYASVAGTTTIGDAPVNAMPPSITPATGVTVGTTLQAHAGSWTIDGNPASGLNYTYAWTNSFDSTTGTGSTYVVPALEAAATITLTVTAHEAGYTDSAAAPAAATVLVSPLPAPTSTRAPVITHTLASGVTTYSVTTGSWNQTGLTYSYEWLLGTTEVDHLGNPDSHSITSTDIATADPSATVPNSDPLYVVVSASKPGSNVGDVTVVAVKGTVPFTQAGDPTIFDARTNADVSGGDCLNYGDHLSIASHGTWTSNDGAVSPTSFTYQWYRSFNNGTTWVAIAHATTPTYVTTTADDPNLNSVLISVVETPVSALYAAVHGDFTSVGTSMISPGFLAPTKTNPYNTLPVPNSGISGYPIDGHTVTATVGSWGTTGVTNEYQWYDCPVLSACTDPTDVSQFLPLGSPTTKSTLVLSQGDFGGVVAVQVTGVKAGYNVVANESAIVQIQDSDQIDIASAPKISGLIGGTAEVGAKLTVSGVAANVTGTMLTYVWQTFDGTNWDPIPGATGTSYTPSVTDLGSNVGDPTHSTIRVVETASKTGLEPGSFNSLSAPIALGALKLVHAGALVTSSTTWTYNVGTYSPAADASVQWLVDGIPTADPSDISPFTLSRSTVNPTNAVSVQIIYSVSGYAPVTVNLLIQRGTTTASPVTIVGTHYGTALGLSVGTDSPFNDNVTSDRLLTYQWYANGVAISHATSPTYPASSSYIGRHITARIVGTSAQYATGIVVSAPITLVAGVFTVPAAPSINYTAPTIQPGVVLTATPDVDSDYGQASGITFLYTWQRSTNGGTTYASIVGGTHSTYVPVATDVTDWLRVIVTAEKAGFGTRTDTSSGVEVQYSPDLATLTPPIASGTTQVASPLTVSTGVWNTPTLTYTYQWYVDGTADPGATLTSFTPVASEVGDLVYAVVTAHRIGWASVGVASNVVVITNAAAPIDTVAPVVTNVGTVYSVSPGTWNVDGLTYSYQWQVNGVNGIGVGATTSSYTPDPSESGGTLTVVIKVTRVGYADGTATPAGLLLP